MQTLNFILKLSQKVYFTDFPQLPKKRLLGVPLINYYCLLIWLQSPYNIVILNILEYVEYDGIKYCNILHFA